MLDVMLEAALRATLIAAAVLLALWLLRVRAAAVGHRVWTVVLLAMLVLPFWIAWAPEIALRVLPTTQSSTSGAVAPLPAPGLVTGGAAGSGIDAMSPPWPAADRTAADDLNERAPAASAAEGSNWRAWLLATYLTGAAALLARLAVGTVRVHALAREARVVNGQLTSDRIATPFTVGLLRPKMLLPEGWDRWPATRLAAVLEHEHAHMRRRDPLVQWLALLNRALFWFHPLAWWLERKLAALAEEASDAAVLAHGHEPVAYSEQLLHFARMARQQHVPPVVGMAMPGSALPARIAKILDGRVARPGSRAAVAGAGALATLAAAALGAITLAQEVTSPALTPAADSFTPLPDYWFEDDEWQIEVSPLMTPEERQAYRSLRSMEDRDRFIGAFWTRRDPTPGTLHNEWRKEYERRIHYADWSFRDPEHPASFGYQTTPGTVYVLLGEPDSVEPVVENGESYEYWHYSEIDGVDDDLTVRIALSQRISCRGPSGSYEIVAPAPTGTFEGIATLGGNAQQPLFVRVYPLGLVTLSIPLDYSAVRLVRATLKRGAGAQPESLFAFQFGAPGGQPGVPPAMRGRTVLGQDGLSCTQPMPSGDYLLTVEAELFSGQHLTDSVAFEVNGI